MLTVLHLPRAGALASPDQRLMVSSTDMPVALLFKVTHCQIDSEV